MFTADLVQHHSGPQHPLGSGSRECTRSGYPSGDWFRYKIIGAAAIAPARLCQHLCRRRRKLVAKPRRSKHACAVVLGLDPSGRSYETCIKEPSIEACPNGTKRGLIVSDPKPHVSPERDSRPGTSAFRTVCGRRRTIPVIAGGYDAITSVR